MEGDGRVASSSGGTQDKDLKHFLDQKDKRFEISCEMCSEIFWEAKTIEWNKTQRKFEKNWRVTERSMEAVVVAEMEKHLLKYFVQHIQKSSEKQTDF